METPQTDILTTPRGGFPIRRVNVDEAGVVYDIMCDAAAWLTSRGNKQWAGVPTDGFRQFLDRRITEWPVFVVERDSSSIATICLQDADPAVWGDAGSDGQAGYIHGLAIRTTVRGHGIGLAMMQWSERLFAAQGRRLLRLDCMAENQRLCRYYRDLGFVEAGIKKSSNWTTQLFEKVL